MNPDLEPGLIDAETLGRYIDAPGWRVIDCRFDLMDTGAGEALWRAERLPGSGYAHLDRHLSSPVTPRSGRHPLPAVDAFIDWLGREGIDADTRVVALDDSASMYAARLWWLLRMLGHRQVAVLDGGFSAWKAAGLPLEQGSPTPVPSVRYRPRRPLAAFEQAAVVSSEEVRRNLDRRDFLLVDVRAPERWRGEQEPIDPVAGHVPGAINRPLTDNVDDRGRFHSAERLRRMYAPLCADWPAERQAWMCGSGVSACQPLLALHAAGLGLPRLYAGSWSEWIRNPEHPIATGDRP